jgi:dTDP-4-dehydrorhamnose reductase
MTNEVNLVLIGADGQLGRALQDLLPRGTTFKEATHYWLHPFAHHARRYRHNWAPALDISDRDATLKAVTSAIEREAALDKFRSTPNIVINVAAWTDTAGCERDPERAMLVNAQGARNVAEAAREAGAALLQVSTNEVFDGEKLTPYAEDDQMNAINAYGSSKQAGE